MAGSSDTKQRIGSHRRIAALKQTQVAKQLPADIRYYHCGVGPSDTAVHSGYVTFVADGRNNAMHLSFFCLSVGQVQKPFSEERDRIHQVSRRFAEYLGISGPPAISLVGQSVGTSAKFDFIDQRVLATSLLTRSFEQEKYPVSPLPSIPLSIGSRPETVPPASFPPGHT